MESNYIAVAGNIGAGKTSLVTQLSQRLGWEPYPENPDVNPFLTLAYDDSRRWALASQIWFLASKTADLETIARRQRPSVLDRSIYENQLFARALLSFDDYAIYEKGFAPILASIKPPRTIVYLDAPVDILSSRIQNRGRPYERGITLPYLTFLQELYEDWAASFTECPIIRLRTEAMDSLVDRAVKLLKETEENER